MDKKLGNNNNKDHIWNKMTGYIFFFKDQHSQAVEREKRGEWKKRGLPLTR